MSRFGRPGVEADERLSHACDFGRSKPRVVGVVELLDLFARAIANAQTEDDSVSGQSPRQKYSAIALAARSPPRWAENLAGVSLGAGTRGFTCALGALGSLGTGAGSGAAFATAACCAGSGAAFATAVGCAGSAVVVLGVTDFAAVTGSVSDAAGGLVPASSLRANSKNAADAAAAPMASHMTGIHR